VPCWFVHQGPVPTPGKLVLDMFKPMYDLSGMGDPWEYWSVHAPSDRSRATIIQNSRFGIGDVTFLALIWGKMEYVETTLKRLSHHTCHLNNGQKLENVTVLVKSLGLLGDFEVDRLHKMKELIGNWISGDYRRVIAIDPLGMNAANFTTFSTGIGTYGGVVQNKYLHDFPKEYNRMVGLGLLTQLPRQQADEKMDRPAYVTDVKFQMTAGIVISTMCPKLQEWDAANGPYKYEMYHRAHGTDRLLKEAIADWDNHQRQWKAQGVDHEYVPYPYTREMIAGFFEEYNKALGLDISIDGPPGIHTKATDAVAPVDGQVNEAMQKGMMDYINTSHLDSWMRSGPKKGALFYKNTVASLNRADVIAAAAEGGEDMQVYDTNLLVR